MNSPQPIADPECVATKRRCSKCRRDLPLSNFCFQSKVRDRRVSECRDCGTARHRVWRLKRSGRMTDADQQLLREIQNRSRFWSGKRLLTEIIQAFGGPDAASERIVRVFDRSESIGDRRNLLVLCRLLLALCKATESVVDLDKINLPTRHRVRSRESR